MPDYPAVNFQLPPVVIMGQGRWGTKQGRLFNAAAWATATYPAASRALAIPFRVEIPTTIQKWVWANGTAVSGNTDMGIYTYDATPAKLVTMGTTANAGVSTTQTATTNLPFTLIPGWYYMAIACDNTTQTFIRRNTGIPEMKVMGWFQMAAAFVLPATLTPAAIASAYVPLFGLGTRTFSLANQP